MSKGTNIIVMRPLTILLTCCGGMVSPSQIYSLRCVAERKIRIVGVDMSETAIGSYLVDKFYKVPPGNDPRYLHEILEICKSEEVDVILPCSHEEALALAKQSKSFESGGIKIAISEYRPLELAFDKGKMYGFLKKSGLPFPEFHIVRSAKEFKDAAAILGYPRNPIVMKPRLSRGGRGARILTNQSVRRYLLYEKPDSLYVNFDNTLDILSEGDEFPEIILMEYLPGEYYSVDLLAKNGKALIIVPKIRLEGTPSQTLLGIVNKNPDVEKAASDICRIFGFSYNVNIEMKYSQKGIPIPYDLNPRPAASVAFCTAAGANLLYFGAKMAMGEDVPEVKIRNRVKMIRSFRELFVTPEKTFYMDEMDHVS